MVLVVVLVVVVVVLVVVLVMLLPVYSNKFGEPVIGSLITPEVATADRRSATWLGVRLASC